MEVSSKKIKLLLIFLGILIILSLSFYQSKTKNFFYSISEPIQRVLWRKGNNTSDFFEGIFGAKDLKRENEELRKYNQELLTEIISLRELRKENETLREALDIELQEDFKLSLADLISKDVSQDFILINKGLEDGLAEGMPVITEQKILLGRISKADKNFSRVILISNPESSFPAQVQEEGITGIVKGKGSFQISLEKIPRDKEIKEGDVVITTSLGGIFPKELLIGEVKKVQKSDIEPFQKVEASPFFSIEELETIFVIISF